MVDVFKVNNTAKCSWIKRLISDTDGKWKPLMWNRLNVNKTLLNRNINIKDLKFKSSFYKQILTAWYGLHNENPQKITEILNQYITHNQHIQVNNSYVNIKNESLHILENAKIGQIINTSKHIMNNLELDQKFGIKIDPWY